VVYDRYNSQGFLLDAIRGYRNSIIHLYLSVTYFRTIRIEFILVHHKIPGELEEAIRTFVEYSYYYRCHEGFGSVSPHDIYIDGNQEIPLLRKEVDNRTRKARRNHSSTVRG
jgi:hypothetical protein